MRISTTPIYQTAAYTFESTEHATRLFSSQVKGDLYSRINNPTTEVFESKVAAIEVGTSALALGMAAQMTSILTFIKPGDEIVSAGTVY